MNRLTRIIGKAPSELSRSELLERLSKERTRVRRAIELWKAGVGLKGKRPAKAKKLRLDRELGLLLKKYNLTEDEALKLMEEK